MDEVIIRVESAFLKNELPEIFDPTKWFFWGRLSAKYFSKMKPFHISFHPQSHWLAQAIQKAKGLQQIVVALVMAKTQHKPHKVLLGGTN